MPVSVLKEEKIFERVIAIRYDVPNDRPDMFGGSGFVRFPYTEGKMY